MKTENWIVWQMSFLVCAFGDGNIVQFGWLQKHTTRNNILNHSFIISWLFQPEPKYFLRKTKHPNSLEVNQ